MSDFGTEMGTAKSILTKLTEQLYADFEGMSADEFRPADILLWVRGLDPSDSVNSYVIECVRRNRGWVKLLAGRVRRHLEEAPRA